MTPAALLAIRQRARLRYELAWRSDDGRAQRIVDAQLITLRTPRWWPGVEVVGYL